MNNKEFHMTDQVETKEEITQEDIETEEKALSEAARMTTSRRAGRRGRKPAKVDVRAKLERSRQSARECRARKKLRYQYLEELVSSREKAIYSLRKELDNYKRYCTELDRGKISADLYRSLEVANKHGMLEKDKPLMPHTTHWCELTLSSDESQDPEEVLPPVRKVESSKGKGVGKGQKVESPQQCVPSHIARVKTDSVSTTSTGSPYALDTPAVDIPTTPDTAQPSTSYQFTTINRNDLLTSDSSDSEVIAGLADLPLDRIREEDIMDYLSNLEQGKVG